MVTIGVIGLRLDVSDALKSPGEEFPFRLEGTLPQQEIFGETVTFDPALISGTVRFEENVLYLSGTLSTSAHGACAACGEPVTFPVEVPVDEVFTRLSHQMMLKREAEKTSDLEEEQLIFEGSGVELEPLALTLTLLELPIRFECVPICEAMRQARRDTDTLNACQKELPDQHPFSALQQLLTKDQEV